MPTFSTSQQWIAEWTELQPLSRFRGAQPSIDHPSELLRPGITEPSDWTLFWLRTRQIAFGVLLGLRMCSPYLAAPNTRPCYMEQDRWVAWCDDVLWVFGQLLHQYVQSTASSLFESELICCTEA